MALVKFVGNRVGYSEILHSAAMNAMLQGKGEAVASAARQSAPVDTGEYRASILVRVVDHPTRSVAQVYSDDDKAQVIESRTGNLARALDAAG